MRILVIEDERKIADAIKKGLEQESFAVDAVYDGESGYDMASAEEYDLIILDRMLPGLDGLRLCRQLREQKIDKPILMLTAKGQVNDRVEGLNSGADDYLVKPFAFEELLARIRALNRRPKNMQGPLLQVADLTLNPITYEVFRGDKPISLSSKEFALLEYLMRNAHKIISKEEIINHVWNFESDVLPNTVEVYIGYLRNKVDKKDYGTPLIYTVRGFGYKISQTK